MKKIITVLLLLVSVQADALIIDSDSYLADTDSGLDWLDVTASVNRTFNEVTSELSSGGEFEGWRYATGTELNVLIGNWTGAITPITSTGTVNHSEGAIDGLVQLLGSTQDSLYLQNTGLTYDASEGYAEGEFEDYTFGILGDAHGGEYHHAALIEDDDRVDGNQDFSTIRHGTWDDEHSRGWNFGSFLIRDSIDQANVPEPTTISLLGLGLLGLVLRRKLV